jgi:hypothetical protein
MSQEQLGLASLSRSIQNSIRVSLLSEPQESISENRIYIGIVIKQLIEMEDENKMLIRFTLVIKYPTEHSENDIKLLINDRLEVSKSQFQNRKEVIVEFADCFSQSVSLEEKLDMRENFDYNPFTIKEFPLRIKVSSYNTENKKIGVRIMSRSFTDFVELQASSWSSNISLQDSVTIQYFGQAFFPSKCDITTANSVGNKLLGYGEEKNIDSIQLTFITRSDQIECLVNNWIPVIFINLFLSSLFLMKSENFESSIIGSFLAIILCRKKNTGRGTLLLYLIEFASISAMYSVNVFGSHYVKPETIVVSSFAFLFSLFLIHYQLSVNRQDESAGYTTYLGNVVKNSGDNKFSRTCIRMK